MKSISEQDFKEYMDILANILGTDAAYVYDSDTIDTIVKAMDRARGLNSNDSEPPMKVIIAGGRTFNDYPRLCLICDNLLKNRPKVEIVSGTANGADQLGEAYALERSYPIRNTKRGESIEPR